MPDIINLLREVNAVITNSHIVYTSGKHGSVYINKDALYPRTDLASQVGLMFAEKYKNSAIDVVAGPMLGGIILSQWTAYHLSQLANKTILSVYAEKTDDGGFTFRTRRNYDKIISGKNILVVEDITNTGASIKKTIKAVRDAGGNVEASCVMVNRSPEIVTSETVGAPFDALGIIKADAYDGKDCPMCQKNIPINTEIGHGKTYLSGKYV